MASEHGYTTLTLLEQHAGRDYSAIDANYLADADVEQFITDAEYFINEYVGTTFTGTIPEGIKLVSKMIAKIFIDNWMIERRIGNMAEINGGVIVDVLERYDIIQILEKYKSLYNPNRGIFISKKKHVAYPYRLRVDMLKWR